MAALERDLRERSEVAPGAAVYAALGAHADAWPAALRSECYAAFDSGRTALPWESWREERLTDAAVA